MIHHRLGGPPARVAAGEDGAHAGAPDDVDRDARFLEGLEDSDVRDAARAAAAEDQADGAVEQPAREPSGVARVPASDVMQARDAGQPGIGRAAARTSAGRRVHDRQVEVTGAVAKLRVAPPREPPAVRAEALFVREDDDAVRLPQTEVQPGGVRAVALQDEEIGSRARGFRATP